ncbi:MAG: Hpt domain-containing protein [Lachnospiraceae bacterium]
MNLEECYESFGGSYQDVKSRLVRDTMIQRLVIKFLADTSYEKLSEAMTRKDYGEAFRAVHTLKGVSQNLSFDCLSQSANALTEVLRKWESESVDEEKCAQLWQQISVDYAAVTGAIRELKESENTDN